MSDQQEEQEMEAEALAAIFDTSFEILSSSQPFQWRVKLLPVSCDGDDEEESDKLNHVAINVKAELPLDYPEHSMPTLSIELLKGLAPSHEEELLQLANEEAEANMGVPSMFAICERLREWLADNNVKGLDDISMHAQMIRRKQEAEKQEKEKLKKQREFESQKKQEEYTEAELEELAVRKRRAEGTPCTRENFDIWKAKFEKEMEEKAISDKKKEELENKTKKSAKQTSQAADKKEEKAGRLTGREHFSGTALANIDLEAIEAAADKEAAEAEAEAEAAGAAAAAAAEAVAENADEDDIVANVDEELFDVDDEDLDDLDFDDDDDDDEQPDI